MLGFYNYTVILTYLGMVSGFTGIVCKGALIVGGIAERCEGRRTE